MTPLSLPRQRSPTAGASDGRVARAFALYAAISAVFTWPLVRNLHHNVVPSDPGDPLLNTAIMWWNAARIPFSPSWWNAPHYYPSWGIAAFTENLVGLAPLTSPIIWLTGNAVFAYNVSFFLTYPLAAIGTYLLVFSLCRRRDAAFLAGVSFAFTPYRAQEVSHIQMLASYGLPACLWAMHRYVEDGRHRWLWVFGVSWVLLSLTNGHYMLFGAVLFAMWLAYFGSKSGSLRRAARLLAAWAIASIPLVPVMYEYQVVHTHYGLIRSMAEILWFSGRPQSWFEAHPNVRMWRGLFPSGKDNLFPGVTAVTATLVGIAALLVRRDAAAEAEPPGRRTLRIVLGLIVVVSVMLTLVTLRRGPWMTMIGPVPFKMTDLNRAIVLILVCGGSLAWMTPRTRDALRRRSPMIFYSVAAVVIALLCCGPVLNAADHPVLNPAPYRLLLALPGFSELRVAVRFWMAGILCLSVGTGLAFAHARRWPRAIRWPAFLLIAAGLLADGWLVDMPLAAMPTALPDVEAAPRNNPILELPVGDHWDWEATYHAAAHRRRTVNGVSGYNPPHYYALIAALQKQDPDALIALASFGDLDVVVNKTGDPDGALSRYVESVPGAQRVKSDAAQTLFHLSATPPEPELGPSIPIANVAVAKVQTLSPAMADAAATHDGKLDTGWGPYPQVPGQWLVIDLGREQTVAAVTNALGDFFIDFPRRIAVDVSLDGDTWDRVWDRPAPAYAFLAYVRGPREAQIRYVFEPHQARYVMLEQLETSNMMWRVSELTVHAPRGSASPAAPTP